jgi:hypothetical protein
MDCRLVSAWRITEADLWDHDHLDLCGPARLVIQDNGSLEVEIAYHLGDEAVLNAIRATSSAAC